MADPTPSPTLIRSVPELKAFLSSILPSNTLYLDLEGHRLSRFGSLHILTILVHPQRVVQVIDILTLGHQAFSTASNEGRTLKSILEDTQVTKCFWDVRNDADALLALHGVRLSNVVDIQLLENASRTGDKTYVRGLDKCIQYDLRLGFMNTHHWIRTKKEVNGLMATDVFSVRPIAAQTLNTASMTSFISQSCILCT